MQDQPKPTEDKRPSHDLLMQATDLLGEARDVEQKAGNVGAAMVLNELTINLFQIALDTEFDAMANAAYARRLAGAGNE